METPHDFTPQEYFDLENKSRILHEYFEGELRPKPETTMAHNTLVQNLAFALRNTVKGRGCGLFIETIKLKVVEGKYYLYPDVMLTCNADDLKDGVMARMPFLVAEVTSAASKAYDKGVKFKQYLKLPSLQCYLLVSMQQPFVECYKRTPQGWLYRTFEDLAEVIELSLMNIELTMAELYAGMGMSENTE